MNKTILAAMACMWLCPHVCLSNNAKHIGTLHFKDLHHLTTVGQGYDDVAGHTPKRILLQCPDGFAIKRLSDLNLYSQISIPISEHIASEMTMNLYSLKDSSPTEDELTLEIIKDSEDQYAETISYPHDFTQTETGKVYVYSFIAPSYLFSKNIKNAHDRRYAPNSCYRCCYNQWGCLWEQQNCYRQTIVATMVLGMVGWLSHYSFNS